jgi:DNA-binding response OmpR family regulator
VNSTVARFGELEFNAVSGELRRGGAQLRLEPQPARVLALLLERAGEVVTRAELQQRVWGGDTFVDFEHGLNYCIAQIRPPWASLPPSRNSLRRCPGVGIASSPPCSATLIRARPSGRHSRMT